MKVLAALLLLASAAAAQRPRRAILLTTDCGAEMDDQWTLAHLALSPELDLRGVVTTHTGDHPLLATPAAESSARLAREVLQHLPLKSPPPVLAGSSLPLRDKTPLANAGVDFLLRESRARPLTVLVIGAATDLASALLTDPTLDQRIEIVAMAFDGWPQGGDPFNVKNDPRAWQVVLESRAPLTVGDTAVAKRHLRMTRERARQLFDARGPAGRYLAELFTAWLDRNAHLARSVMGDPHAWTVWDEVTAAHLLGLTKTKSYPRPRLRLDLALEHPGASPAAIQWITGIESDKLWQDLAGKLSGR